MNNKRTLSLLAIVLTIIVCVVWYFFKSHAPNNSISKIDPSDVFKQELPELARPDISKDLVDQVDLVRTPEIQDRANFAASLEGTYIDGALVSDQQGNLILSIDVRDFFDYFLSASDEIGPEAAIDEIVRYAQEYLPEKAAQQSVEILRNYLRYKKSDLELQSRPIANYDLSDGDTQNLLTEYFLSLKEIRSGLFNQQVDRALFELEDSYSSFTLASLKLRSDASLTTQQREQELAQLRAALPVELSRSYSNQKQVKLTQEKVSALIKSDIDDAQLYDELLAQDYSKDNAQRLISDRQQKKIFEQRYASYRIARQQALEEITKQGKSQNQSDQAELVRQLRKAHFINSEDQTRAALRDKP